VGAITIQRIAVEGDVPHPVRLYDFDPAEMERAQRCNL